MVLVQGRNACDVDWFNQTKQYHLVSIPARLLCRQLLGMEGCADSI